MTDADRTDKAEERENMYIMMFTLQSLQNYGLSVKKTVERSLDYLWEWYQESGEERYLLLAKQHMQAYVNMGFALNDLSESGLAKVLAMAADGAAIQPVIGEATALEITKRQADGEDLYFIINFKDEEIPLPVVFDGKEDILTGEKVQGGEMLKKYDLRIVSVPRA